MMMLTMMAATTLTVVMGADGDIDQCELAPYTDQCVPQCGGKPENVECPLSELAHDSWAKGLWSDWGLDNVDNYVSNVGSNVENYVSTAESNVENYVSNAVNHDWGGWHKGNDNTLTYPADMCNYQCSECSVMCGGSLQNMGSCMTSCTTGGANFNVPNVPAVPNVVVPNVNVPKVPDIPTWTVPDVPDVPNWTAPNWSAWAKSAGIEDYNGTSTGTWSDEDADVVVPAAAGDAAVTAASVDASSSSMGAASSLALLVATVATMMMM